MGESPCVNCEKAVECTHAKGCQSWNDWFKQRWRSHYNYGKMLKAEREERKKYESQKGKTEEWTIWKK